ncbi:MULTISPECIES: NF038130 family PEP-CTERM protein [unclassified Coleofasciculus]|uniref:NF038130 family PEP-CTERM protein n=1 Tax=unclassified Coleofasciculus TaxID=2692782 RepID=UPI00187F62E1|nr:MULTISPECIES: NF038130 family PEP-CTERM protein [unclassified Coleofasciculus]MBE9128358.1 NF038130 family PEP-CTERM protein [Coleofasciculus sp. LEGE 07081]MBE9151414.1 NF038130 family PEP-CTERM protein [Coleofasciculus sp. LEGE 07092]
MNGTIQKLLLGASMVAGVSAIASSPALAGTLTGASVSGTAGTDYYIYEKVGNQTVRNDSASLATVLQGSCTVVAGACNPAGSPGGNVELFANSEQSPLSPSNPLQAVTAFKSFLNYNTTTSLTGQIGGKGISLSSLTAVDWFGATNITPVTTGLSQLPNPILKPILFAQQLTAALDPLYNPSNLATQWFNTALSTYSVPSSKELFNTFLLAGGFQRFSDPNISYVNQDDTTGEIRIGLAGHYDALALLGFPPIPAISPIQASEVVKVTYDNGTPQYLYSFTAANSGLTEQGDGHSHNGNYEVTLPGDPPASVPEPSAVLGLMAMGGLVAAKRKLKKG